MSPGNTGLDGIATDSAVPAVTSPPTTTKRFLEDLTLSASARGLVTQRRLVQYAQHALSISCNLYPKPSRTGDVYDLLLQSRPLFLVQLANRIGNPFGIAFGRAGLPVATVHIVHEPSYIIDVLVKAQAPLISGLAELLNQKGYSVTLRQPLSL